MKLHVNFCFVSHPIFRFIRFYCQIDGITGTKLTLTWKQPNSLIMMHSDEKEIIVANCEIGSITEINFIFILCIHEEYDCVQC